MITHYWQVTLLNLIALFVFIYPENGYALEPEQTPPFLLIDNPSSEKNTETTNSVTDNQPLQPVNDSIVSANKEKETDNISNDEADAIFCEDIDVAVSIAEPPFFSFLDGHQKLISNYLHKTVLGVDNFFANKQSTVESTGSHLKLTIENIWTEGQGSKFDGSISLRARLPGIKEKYRLVVESDPDEQRDLLDLESSESDPGTNQNQSDGLYTGLEKKIGLLNWKVHPSLGIKIRSPLDYYARLRFDRSEFFDYWALYLNESIYWFDSFGFGFDSTMRWDRPLSSRFLFRTTSLIRYTDIDDLYNLSQTAEIIQTISRKRAITYKIGAFGNSENSLHATDYLVNLLYRHNIHSDYLFLDLQPQIFFSKDNNFEAQYEFIVRIEIYYRD